MSVENRGKPFASVERLMASAKLSEVTKRNYMMRVNQYLKEAKMNPDELVRWAKSKPRKFEESFIAFIQQVPKRSSPSTTMSFRDSVKRFLEINRVTGINWQYVNEFVPSAKKAGQDRAPTPEEIRRIIDVADLRTKCLVLFLCSSGARIGSVPYLKWRDVEDIDVDGRKLTRVTIYKGEPEEYTTFITPECTSHWQEYRHWRESIGEKITGASYVFVTQGNATEFNSSSVRPVSVKTLKNLLGRLLRNLEIRSEISERGGYRNYEFKQAHGFRKFFKTRMEVAGVKPIITELLMGHGIGVASSYMKPSTEEMLAEYAKGIPALTILSREKDKAELRADMKNQLLLVAGFKAEEIGKMDLSKASDEEFQRMVREKLLGVMANNGSRQKVIPTAEVERYISQGWEYVASLPDDRAILKLPVD